MTSLQFFYTGFLIFTIGLKRIGRPILPRYRDIISCRKKPDSNILHQCLHSVHYVHNSIVTGRVHNSTAAMLATSPASHTLQYKRRGFGDLA